MTLPVGAKAGLKDRLRDRLPAWLWSLLRKAKAGVKTLVRALLPGWLRAHLAKQRQHARNQIRLARNYLYDASRFKRYSADRSSLSRENLRALITMDYHRIEKGLALRDPRVGFGSWFLPRLLSNLQTYLAAYGPDRVTAVAINAILAWVDFNEKHGHEPTSVRDKLAEVCLQVGETAARGAGEGGVRRLSAREVREKACLDLEGFFRSRHSIRHFGGETVPREAIEKAVSMASYSPSVCNREGWRVHVYSDGPGKASVLNHQNGNRGFGDQAAHVLIVTTEIQSFASIGERNQCWIDGGMFAMSLVYALHSLGLGTCCLNWCAEKETDTALRACAGIPDSQVVIMMLAIGPLPEEFVVAQSPRKSLGEVIVFHDRGEAEQGSQGGGGAN
jgi:nitroreductase